MLGSGWKKGDGSGPLRGALSRVYGLFAQDSSPSSSQAKKIETFLSRSARRLAPIKLKGMRDQDMFSFQLSPVGRPDTIEIGRKTYLQQNFEVSTTMPLARGGEARASIGGVAYVSTEGHTGKPFIIFDLHARLKLPGTPPVQTTPPPDVVTTSSDFDIRLAAYAGFMAAMIGRRTQKQPPARRNTRGF